MGKEYPQPGGAVIGKEARPGDSNYPVHLPIAGVTDGDGDHVNQGYVQQAIEHRDLAEDQHRPQPAGRSGIHRPQKQHRRAKRHQKKQERRWILRCVQKRECGEGRGFLSAPTEPVTVDVDATQNEETPTVSPIPSRSRKVLRRLDGKS
jgi:hypothetical protein